MLVFVLITSENDDLYGWNSGVEPKKPIPAELKESFEKDFDLFKEITLNVYIDDNLKNYDDNYNLLVKRYNLI